jgi:integrase
MRRVASGPARSEPDADRPADDPQRRAGRHGPVDLRGKPWQSTRTGKPRRGMSGEDRSWLYVLALFTGLRRGELQALRPEDFDLDGSPPMVSLDGQFTTNGKPALQPLLTSLLPELRTWLATRPAHVPTFPTIGIRA